MKFIVVIGCSLMMLSACGQRAAEEKRQHEAEWKAMTTVSSEEIHHLFDNRTVLFGAGGFGMDFNQVEYYSPSGFAALWYAGNTRVLPGKWWKKNNTEVCFQYSVPARDPSGKVGTDPHCELIVNWKQLALDSAAGDVFGLSRGTLPKILERNHFYRHIRDLQLQQPSVH